MFIVRVASGEGGFTQTHIPPVEQLNLSNWWFTVLLNSTTAEA